MEPIAIKKSLGMQPLVVGLAIFSMFFGAGNVIFPLAVGQFAGDKNFFSSMGLLLTATLVPILGVIAMVLCDGKYRLFFNRLGAIPGFCLALIIISLLGPLGSTPRCIALSYAAFSNSFLEISSASFSLIACGLIFLLTFRKKHLFTICGTILTPLLLIALALIVSIGFFTADSLPPSSLTSRGAFFYGMVEGYNTMDLLASFFFSSTILHLLKMRSEPSQGTRIALWASLIGGGLLGVVYLGFSYLAAFHGAHIASTKDELLASIMMHIAGPYAGPLVCLTIGLACLTTAIALLLAFVDFMQKEVFKERVPDWVLLMGALIVTFFISTFELNGIGAFLSPILQICYPGLIVLTLLNLLHHFTGFKMVKIPVFCTFAFCAFRYFLS